MSKEHDDAGLEILKQAGADHHDRYLQGLISKFDDPDYDDYPIVIDSDGLSVPDNVDFKLVRQALKIVLERVEQLILGD